MCKHLHTYVHEPVTYKVHTYVRIYNIHSLSIATKSSNAVAVVICHPAAYLHWSTDPNISLSSPTIKIFVYLVQWYLMVGIDMEKMATKFYSPQCTP